MLDVQVNAVTPDVIREVSGRFGIVPRAFTQLGRSQNLVLGITDEAILKLTDANYRSLSDLEAEAEFVRFLSDKGFSVCAAKPSAGGHLFETVRANGQTFYASVQKRAKGCAVRRKDASAYNMDLFRLLGVTMGRMHAAMRDFRPAHPRFAYDTDPAVQGGDLLIEARCGRQWRIVTARSAAVYGRFHATPPATPWCITTCITGIIIWTATVCPCSILTIAVTHILWAI